MGKFDCIYIFYGIIAISLLHTAPQYVARILKIIEKEIT